MAFKLSKSVTFTATATITVPTDDGPLDQTVGVRFKLLPEEAALELPPQEFLKRAILRLDDVLDDDGKPMQSSPEMIDQVLSLPFTRLPLSRAYWEALTGARLGN